MRSLRSKHVGKGAGARGPTSAVRTDTLEAFRSAEGKEFRGRSLPVCSVPAGSAVKARRRAGLWRAEQTETIASYPPGTFADMSPGRDEDLDWLYGHDPQQAELERTRVMPSSSGPAEADSQRAAPYPPPSRTPQPRPGRPASGPPRGPGRPGRPAAPQPNRRRRQRHPVRKFFRVLLILLLLFILWLVAVPAYAWTQIARVDAAPSGQRPADQPGKTFLLVGSDSRAGLSRAEQRRLGTGRTGGQRTDSIMLIYLPPGGKSALISLPRDSYVDIPGHGKNKINAAYAFGGPELMVQTIEHNTKLRVDGYMEIGFGGFVNVIDALGGIRMCLPNAIKDRDSHLDLPKGCQTLSGAEALGYVRMRKADPRGDLGRIERQREMLAAVADKAASPVTVLNPIRYWNFCMATADAIKLGRDTSLPETLLLGLALKQVSGGRGLTLTVPVSNTGASTSVGSAVLWDPVKSKAMFSDIARGDTSGLNKYAK
jgi:LCP family protein required for cell wall assembly